MPSQQVTLSSSTNAENANNESNGVLSLDRRMELLESRFTTPMHVQQQTFTHTSPEVETLLASPHASQHSFGFEATSGSNTASNVSSSNLGEGVIRSKKSINPSKPRRSSFDQVKEAAERHMQRVMAASPLTMEQQHSHSSASNAASNQTVLTSHKSAQEVSSKARVVVESPPTLAITSAITAEPQMAVKPALVTGDTCKRKSIPMKRPQPSVTDARPSSTTTQSNATSTSPNSNKRKRLAFGTEEVGSPKLENSSHSRSNPAKTNKLSKDKDKENKKQVVNNAKINQFFAAMKKNVRSDGKTEPETMSETSSAEVEALRARCQELEQSCKEMEGQLKAVSNNQTIMHTALKAALCKREKELEELKKKSEEHIVKTSRVLEEFIRQESAREATQLRQQLASDGARLGRITYTRAGMRAVEAWEEGHASKALQQRRIELESRKQYLAELEQSVEESAKLLSEGKKVTEIVAGVTLSDPLAIVEAKESVRLHLVQLHDEWGKLTEEEHKLNAEKAEHIRALKRVASEDASRFRPRPKLHDRYVLLSLLGKGGFSEVWRAYDLTDLREVAVKIHQLDPRWSEAKKDNYTKHVSREYEIHRDVRHARIVSLFDVFEIDNNSFATVLEYCKGTDLDSLLKEKRRLPERDARAILLQILSGMNYLSHPSGNRQGIIHYDLKPGNILFDEHGYAKITDFGLSKIVDTPDPAESMELTSQGAGTYWYLPPECFITSQTVRISNKVDVWSIGVIFYQMLYGKRPFGDGMSQDRVLTDNTMLNAREVRFPDSPTVSPEGTEFIRQCLTYDQAFRPTMAQICKSPYVLQKKFE